MSQADARDEGVWIDQQVRQHEKAANQGWRKQMQATDEQIERNKAEKRRLRRLCNRPYKLPW